ncbi:MAG: protein kinase [Verrucomicrobia bacterium]|nr:protein kinase [Verrucomicrobiota bacterium]
MSGLPGAQGELTTLAPTLVVPRAGELFAGYELLEEVARGGMGMVFRARKPGASEDVALKMILPFRLNTPGIIERFRVETAAVAKLKHANLLPIYESGEHLGLPFFSMKFAAHGSLATAIGRFVGDFRRSAAILVPVADAVHYAHQHKIIHRDLKPANILLDEQDTPYVSDFGLAKALGPDSGSLALTQANAVIGTPHYAAPEQSGAVSERLTPSADVFSLGAILFELCSGQPPWAGSTMFTILKRSAEEGAPPLRESCPRAPRELEIICQRCLQADPALRYPTAAAFREDLQRYLEGRPLASFSPPFAARARRFARRRKWWLAAAGGLALAASGLGLGLSMREATPNIDLTGTQSQEALYFIKRSLEINPTTNIAERRHLESTQEMLLRALKADPEYAAAHAELSRVHSQIYWHFHDRSEQRAEQARTAAEESLRLKPGYGRGLLALAEYHFRVRREDARAVELLEQARSKSPRDPDVYNLMQLVAKRQGRWADAVASAKRLTELRPTNAADHFYLGITYDTMRRYPEAIAQYDRAMYLAPDRGEYLLPRALSFFRWKGELTELGKWVQRIPLPQPAIGSAARPPASAESSGGYDERFWTRYSYYRWLRQTDLMRRLVESKAPGWAYVDKTLWIPRSQLLAQIAALEGRSAEVPALLEEAHAQLAARVAAGPEEARVLASLGTVLALQGRRAEALQAGQRAVELMPVDKEPIFGPDVQASLAEICLLCGESDRGIRLLRDLLGRPGDLTSHELRLDPRWDFARQVPGFAALTGPP